MSEQSNNFDYFYKLNKNNQSKYKYDKSKYIFSLFDESDYKLIENSIGEMKDKKLNINTYYMYEFYTDHPEISDLDTCPDNYRSV